MPSPISAYDLITTAMRKMGVLAAGETPSADEANTGLQALNDVIETFNLQNLALTGGLPATFTTTAGLNTYTIGVGGTWNGQRPVSIFSAYCTLTGVDFPIALWSLEEWMNEPVKSTQQPIIERMVYVNSSPLGNVILWPTPSQAVSVTLNYEDEISQVASLATTLTLPPGYARALQYAVAVELQSEFGGQDMTAYARATLAIIKRANRSAAVVQFDPALGGGSPFLGARGY